MAQPGNFGGHDYRFVDQVLDRFTCETICTKVLKDPHLTVCCGQHFCESCLNNWFTRQRKKTCPHCRAAGEGFQHVLNKSLKREIDSLRIHCTNEEEGCQWIGELGSLKQHLESDDGCGYVEVECPNKCEVRTYPSISLVQLVMGFQNEQNLEILKMQRKYLQSHLKNTCYLRPYKCGHCGHKGTYKEITGRTKRPLLIIGSDIGVPCQGSHYDKCPNYPLRCPNKCGRFDIKRKDMEDHRSQCPEEEVECPNKCHYTEPISKKRLAIRMKRKFLERHLTKKCELRPYQCKYCGFKGTYSAITTKHYNICTEIPLECPNKCGKRDIKRKEMKDHHSQCPEEPVQCPFEEVGCKEKLVRHELKQHMSATQQQHLLMVIGAYKEMKRENIEMKTELYQVKKELSQTKVELKQIFESRQFK